MLKNIKKKLKKCEYNKEENKLNKVKTKKKDKRDGKKKSIDVQINEG